jgi:hypothetical protein
MDAIFFSVDFWHWLVLGILLILTEFFAWSVYLLWVGISAIVVGATLYFFPSVSWEIQLLIFLTLSAITTYLANNLNVRE